MTIEEYAESRGWKVISQPRRIDGDDDTYVLAKFFVKKTRLSDGTMWGYQVGPLNESDERWPEAWKVWLDLADRMWELKVPAGAAA